LRRGNAGPVRGDDPLELAHGRGLRIDVLLRDQVLGQQSAIAIQRDLGAAELGQVARELTVDLVERDLERARIDLRERLGARDRLTFFIKYLGHDALDLRVDRRHGERRHGAERFEPNRNIG
jgi:hypothetical protein